MGLHPTPTSARVKLVGLEGPKDHCFTRQTNHCYTDPRLYVDVCVKAVPKLFPRPRKPREHCVMCMEPGQEKLGTGSIKQIRS